MAAAPNVTRELAAWVKACRLDDIPEDVRRGGRAHLLQLAGLRGRRRDATRRSTARLPRITPFAGPGAAHRCSAADGAARRAAARRWSTASPRTCSTMTTRT